MSSGRPSGSAAKVFIRGLAYACSKDAVFLTDATFVRPRTAVDEHGFDGQALFLACHIMENPEQEQSSNKSMEVDEEEEDTAETSAETSYPTRVDSGSSSEGYTRNAFGFKIALLPPPPSINVSTDGHILPGCGKHTCAALPFLCVANQENIDDLMSSAAYQRYVWGIAEPVLGFLLSPAGHVATLFLSWVDPDTKILHVASANPEENTVCSFRFSDLHSSLRFAQFVLNLSTRFANVAQRGSPLSENNKLDWRADNPKTQDPGTFRNRVEQWVRGVYLASNVDVPHLQHPNDFSRFDFSEESLEDMSSLAPESAGSQKKARSLEIKYRNNSSFGGLAPEGFRPGGGADALSWLFDRNSHRLCLVEHDLDAFEKVNKVVRDVREMCKFNWLSKWDNNSPTVDLAVKPFLDHMLKQARERKSSETSSQLPELSAEYTAFIEAHLSYAFYASAGAYTLLHRKQGLNLKEAEWRLDWDAMLRVFYGSKEEIISALAMFEKTVFLSRNPLVDDIMQGKDVIRPYHQEFQYYVKICVSEVASAGSNVEAISLASKVLSQATDLEISWRKFTESTPELQINEHLLKHDIQEPRDGICDGVLVAAIPIGNFPVEYVDDVSFFVDAYDNEISESKVDENQSAPALQARAPTASPAAVLAKSNKGTTAADLKYAVENPFRKTTITSELKPPIISSPPTNFNKTKTIILPHVLAEYKKVHDKDAGAALNQARLYLVSMIMYYFQMGITDRAFYCLVTSGSQGALIAGCKSSETKKVFIFERDVVTFNLSSPIDVLHLATVLVRLREDQESLKVEVKAKLEALAASPELLRNFKNWRKSVQTPKTSAPKKLPEESGHKVPQ
ncbi:hypothetical protein FB45DRAFT_1013733 [Roridomyces roridus]|uniref:Uncharacterized protein n=1 Tax=Roridomyces roridus TaxID=1738132 RepID=A0AAD7AYC7_9AGAR|nr:hypothetical protein FB45DRAFT_1013733 [Roridomyces roridus]